MSRPTARPWLTVAALGLAAYLMAGSEAAPAPPAPKPHAAELTAPPTTPMAPTPTSSHTPSPSHTPTPTSTPSPKTTPSASPTAGPTPTLTPSPFPSPTLVPTPTPKSLTPYTIPALAARRFGEGDILVREQLSSPVDPSRRYVVEYPSDGITVTALMNVPHGDGPFPVILVLHGYIDPAEYERGDDSRPFANYLTAHGYAAIMPDYRGYAGSPGSPNPMRIPYAIDVLNLIESLDTLDYLDAKRVGVFGHSMGGGIATYPMVVSPRVDATVLYAAMSADQAANWHYIREKWARFWMDFTAREFGGSPDDNPEGFALISPINYLERVAAPVQIHHGADDQEVPVEWSADLAERLLAAGVNVTYYEYEDAGHTFRYADQSLLFERALAFFDEHVR